MSKPYVLIPNFEEQQPEDTVIQETVLDRLRKAARVCNLLISGKRVPNIFPEERSLEAAEIQQIMLGMDYISFMMVNSQKWPRALDFQVDSFCDCGVTSDCLRAVGILSFWDIVKSGDRYLQCLSIAETFFGANKQYHMLALAN